MSETEALITNFVKDYRKRAIAYLLGSYKVLSVHDCEDIFQDSIIILYNKIFSGEKIKYSLYTYFIEICKNKAYETLRKLKKEPLLNDDLCDKDVLQCNIDKLISLDYDIENEELKSNTISGFVKILPEPCKTIFKYVFYDNLKLKTIATMENKEVGAIKTSKSRCMKKFKTKYGEVIKSLIDK